MPADLAQVDALIVRLISRIEAAFADAKHPGDGRLLHPQCFDNSDIRDFYGGVRWRQVPAEVIERNNASLCFFGPEAFRFYLPAFLLWTLRNYRTSDSFTVDSTIYSLDPGQDDLRAFILSKLSALTAPQREAVVAFLEFMRDHSDGHADAEAAARALDSFWLRHTDPKSPP